MLYQSNNLSNEYLNHQMPGYSGFNLDYKSNKTGTNLGYDTGFHDEYEDESKPGKKFVI